MTDTNDKFAHARANAKAWFENIVEMVGELHRIQDNQSVDGSEDDARQKIEESVLSVDVRDGWRAPGHTVYDQDGPDEYQLLLSTGGPALRIYGRLDSHCQPESAELQMQDWGTQWERFQAPEATLLAFASCFYFGDD